MKEKQIVKDTVLLVTHGSRAYGTDIPGSDYDEKGITILSDPHYYFGFKKFEQKDSGWEDGNDRVIYDIRKFFRLALSCNPNIIEVLFVEPEQRIKVDWRGQEILAMRDSFLSRSAAKTFTGYALSQLKRLENKVKADKPINYKHAMHLIRLLRMGKEIIEDGKVNVKRPDAKELKLIRLGKVSLEDIMGEAGELLVEVDNATARSPLPIKPDRDGAEKLMVELIRLRLM